MSASKLEPCLSKKGERGTKNALRPCPSKKDERGHPRPTISIHFPRAEIIYDVYCLSDSGQWTVKNVRDAVQRRINDLIRGKYKGRPWKLCEGGVTNHIIALIIPGPLNNGWGWTREEVTGHDNKILHFPERGYFRVTFTAKDPQKEKKARKMARRVQKGVRKAEKRARKKEEKVQRALRKALERARKKARKARPGTT